jgi:hypothetical protein
MKKIKTFKQFLNEEEHDNLMSIRHDGKKLTVGEKITIYLANRKKLKVGEKINIEDENGNSQLAKVVKYTGDGSYIVELVN